MYWKTENQYLNQIILVFTHIEYFLSSEKWTGCRRICYFWGSTTSDSKGLFSYFKENENKLGAHPQYFSEVFSPMLIITVKSRCPEPFGQQSIWRKPNENHTKMWKPTLTLMLWKEKSSTQKCQVAQVWMLILPPTTYKKIDQAIKIIWGLLVSHYAFWCK